MTTPSLTPCPIVHIDRPFFAGQEYEHTVVFGLSTLERIEIAMEMSTGELMMKLAEMSGRSADGTINQAAAIKGFRVGFVSKFVAACLDWDMAKVNGTIPPAHLLTVFRDLCGGFSKAASQLYGVSETETPANPPVPAGGAG